MCFHCFLLSRVLVEVWHHTDATESGEGSGSATAPDSPRPFTDLDRQARSLRNSRQIGLLLIGLLLQVLDSVAFSTLPSHYHSERLSRVRTFVEISYLLMSQTTLDLGFYTLPPLHQFNEMLNVTEGQGVFNPPCSIRLQSWFFFPTPRTYIVFHVTVRVTDLFCNCCINFAKIPECVSPFSPVVKSEGQAVVNAWLVFYSCEDLIETQVSAGFPNTTFWWICGSWQRHSFLLRNVHMLVSTSLKKKKTMLVREERNVDSFIFCLSLSSKEGRESIGKEKINF